MLLTIMTYIDYECVLQTVDLHDKTAAIRFLCHCGLTPLLRYRYRRWLCRVPYQQLGRYYLTNSTYVLQVVGLYNGTAALCFYAIAGSPY